jgi:hypothetical protein
VIDLTYQLMGLSACSVIIWRTEPTLARMTPDTHWAVRLAIWTTLMGAVARVWWIFTGGVPDPITVLMLIAFALLISCERRLQVLTRRGRRPDSYVRK